jgi:hypothetical protein
MYGKKARIRPDTVLDKEITLRQFATVRDKWWVLHIQTP